MNGLEALVLGIVEGLTEFLPVSSTAHLLLTQRILDIPDSAQVTSFVIAVQVGAIAAVLARYWKTLTTSWETDKRILVAFVPTAVIGAVLYRVITAFFFSTTSISILALGIGGVLLLVFERWHRESPEAREDLSRLPYRTAFLIGCAQAIAVIPGVSRAAATIVGGLLLGLKRRTVVEFSFLLALPTLVGATVLDLVQQADQLTDDALPVLLVGLVAAFVVARLTVSWLLRYVETHSFVAFGWYRIVVAAFVWALLR